DDPERGLLKMCIDISDSIFHTLASEGVVFGKEVFRSLKANYLRQAEDTIWKYAGDADINGLVFDRHEEGLAVETFARGLEIAGQRFMEIPAGRARIPNWSRVADALPNIQQQLVDAVASDCRIG
ncbi:MAG: glycosyl transferase, partial [Candidatus Krumholzibacteria bacterium]|nr:glycosyl transferase [Candidatus Krumholzibacteria bacterium]